MATNKAIIVLQENSGVTPLDSSIPEPIRGLIRTIIDALTEGVEDIKNTLQAVGHYDTAYLLTDNSCTRAALLNVLVEETKKGRTIDLVILGHGSPELLVLKATPNLTGGIAGTIRTLLPDAIKMGVNAINLRMVYMCNCYGSTTNDDWLAIGAKVSIGSRAIDWMPEPMTTFFLHNWIEGEKAHDAAKNAYDTTIPFYLPIYPPTPKIKYKTVVITYPCPTRTEPFRKCKKSIQVPDGVEFIPHTNVQQSELIVAGDQNITFATLTQGNSEGIIIFSDANFNGSPSVLTLGNYDYYQLGIPNDSLSSLKVSRGYKVTLYEHGGFTGKTKVFTEDATYVGDDFNDITSGVKVERMQEAITIFTDANFSGSSSVLPVGNYDYQQLGIPNDSLSSLKIPAGYKVTLYEHGGFAGKTKVFTGDAAYVSDDFNDITSGIRVEKV